MTAVAAPAAALRLREVAAATGGRVVSGAPEAALPGVSIDTRTLRSRSTWARSWPLPAITTTSPGPASSRARAIASRRSTIT